MKIHTSLAAPLSFLALLALPAAALAAGPSPVNLLSAGNFAILAQTGISTTGSTVVVGNIGVSPAAATYITGFSLNLPAGAAFATSPEVTGNVYAPGYALPTPTTMTTAVNDMQTAYVDGAGRTDPTATELGAGNIGGLTLAPGLYTWSTGVTIPTSVTLSGGANDVWIFQIAQNLTVSSGVQVILSGGAQASNVFWVVAGQTTIGTGAVFNGTILDQTAIVLNTGAVLNGHALAQTAVTLDANSVTSPTASVTTPTYPVTPPPTTMPLPVYTPTPTTVTPIETITPGVSTLTLNSQQQVEYNQLIAAGASQSAAFAAAGQVTTSVSSPIASSWPIASIGVNLWQGESGANISTLQQFLITANKGAAAESLAQVGATGYFGVLTKAALAEFQAQAGISPPVGYFGPLTRAYVEANY